MRAIGYKRLAGYTALVLGTLATVYVTYRLGQVVLLFALSVLTAAALRVPMLWLQRRRIPRGVAILLLYVLMLGTLVGVIFLVGRPLRDELTTAGERFPQLYDTLLRQWEASPSQWQQTIATTLPTTDEMIASIGQDSSQLAYQVAGLSYSVANLVISLVAVLTLTFYWLIDEERFVRLWLMLLPVQQRMVARQVWLDVDSRVGTFVRSEALQFVATLLLLWTGFWALGVTYPASWALFGAVAQLIPWVGIPLTLLPAIPMFWTDPLSVMAGALALVAVVGTVMDRVIEPRLGVAGIVHPIVSVLALFIMGELAGVIGMAVALPLAAMIQSVIHALVHNTGAPRAATAAIYSTQLQDLRARSGRLRQELPSNPAHRLALEGMVQRLDHLLDNTEQLVRTRATAAERPHLPETHSPAAPLFARASKR